MFLCRGLSNLISTCNLARKVFAWSLRDPPLINLDRCSYYCVIPSAKPQDVESEWGPWANLISIPISLKVFCLNHVGSGLPQGSFDRNPIFFTSTESGFKMVFGQWPEMGL